MLTERNVANALPFYAHVKDIKCYVKLVAKGMVKWFGKMRRIDMKERNNRHLQMITLLNVNIFGCC